MSNDTDQAGWVEFSYVRPDAMQVFLVGSFNGWNPRANRMHRDLEGRWSCHVQLPAGTYQFHYLAQIPANLASHGGMETAEPWSCSNLEFVLVTPRGGSCEIAPPLSHTTGESSQDSSPMQQDLLPLSRLERALIRCFRQLPDHESRSAFLDVLQESVYC